MQLITINEAAQLSEKSVQTIRRMIKQKKIEIKRQKTPQGFNYLIVKESLLDLINKNQTIMIEDDSEVLDQTPEVKQVSEERTNQNIDQAANRMIKHEVDRFTETMQKLIDQHERDKDRDFQLIRTFQERVVTLEGHIKMLESPKSKWWRFWK